MHANCRIRRIYFSDRLYSEEELPPEFKLFLPIQVSPGSSVATGLLQVEWLISGRVGFRWTRTESSWLGQMIRYQMAALMKRQTRRGTRHKAGLLCQPTCLPCMAVCVQPTSSML